MGFFRKNHYPLFFSVRPARPLIKDDSIFFDKKQGAQSGGEHFNLN